MVRALTSFHERQIQKHRIALKRQTRPIAPGDTKVVHRSTDGNKNKSEIAHSANSDTNVTTGNVTKIAESIQEKFKEFNDLLSKFQESFQNKDMKQYTCLLSETPNTNEGKRVTNNPNVAKKKKKKRKERKIFKREEQKHETFEANKKHIKKTLQYRTYKRPSKPRDERT